MKPIDCFISGHYYKMELGKASDDIGIKYHVKCVRCGDRILINDKSYYARKEGKYNL
jgi:DNA-directed RNA polymerase subunit RPC12/RpoP